ncbi:cytochrome P450 307a1-like [Coccinella septempunctata]|uniref:cytochrome P450 307a1-like n=1 Tax=Coccinella septempunctata TaxID=41139 RepID=UPI001D0894DF|nr:cytochrome P450 307a1-like [Coccinella septempunctata]
MSLLLFSQFTIVLSVILVFIVLLVIRENRRSKSRKTAENGLPDPPVPFQLPLIGHLHLLGGYEVPYQAFTDIGKKYGNVVRLQLGNVKCVVVNDQKNIREAIINKSNHFDARPNFVRYEHLFSGNKQNSLAFCDWSEVQKTRREMLRAHTFPRITTNIFSNLEGIIHQNTRSMVAKLGTGKPVNLKPIIVQHCANIFTKHFCTRQFSYNDSEFLDMVEDFDEIFYEVNQGYAADFLPFLMPLHKKNLRRISTLTHNIRNFILGRIIEERYETFNVEEEPKDYVESLIKHVRTEAEFDWETALFALEDIIGGHSAVGNFIMKLFGFLVKETEVQKKIQEEIDRIVSTEGRDVVIGDRNKMPYTEATINEAVRLIASPIVPRVSNQDSSIDGYRIEKDTLLFLNNYDLSMSDKLWDEPEKFMPERFIKDGKVMKPDHFLPFGGGKRSCMGYKMVNLISLGIIGGLLQHYTISPVDNEEYKVPIGSLALPKNTFQFRFTSRLAPSC